MILSLERRGGVKEFEHSGQTIPKGKRFCACCGEISGTQVDCRVFLYRGRQYSVPPKAMLAEAILQKAFVPPVGTGQEPYVLPENLKRFFEGKERKKACCSGTCC